MDSAALARLKAVAGRQTLTLTHYGRKSGKPYEVTIWFVLEGDKVYLGTANANRQWVRNVQKTPKIRLSIDVVLRIEVPGTGPPGVTSGPSIEFSNPWT